MMAQPRIFCFFPLEREDLAATRPCLALQIGNYVTLTMGFRLDTSGQISEPKGTQGCVRAKRILCTAGYDVSSCPLKNKAETLQRIAFKSTICWHNVLLVRKHVFCVKIRFPWKEQWQNQRGQGFGGAEKNRLLCPEPLEVRGAPSCSRCLASWLESEDRVSCSSLAGRSPPGSQGGHSTKHPDRCCTALAWLTHHLRVPRGPGAAGVALPAMRLPTPNAHRPPPAPVLPCWGPAPPCGPRLWPQLGTPDLEA